jgi:hypothetical protein
MGKFNNSNNNYQYRPSKTDILKEISVEVANLAVLPIWERLNITELEYIDRENAIEVKKVETEIITDVLNGEDIFADESLINTLQNENTTIIADLEASTTIIDTTSNVSVGTIVQQLEAIISARLNAM